MGSETPQTDNKRLRGGVEEVALLGPQKDKRPMDGEGTVKGDALEGDEDGFERLLCDGVRQDVALGPDRAQTRREPLVVAALCVQQSVNVTAKEVVEV